MQLHQLIFSIGLFACFAGCSSARLDRDIASAKGEPSGRFVTPINADGAWCWFADPRAIETEKAVYISSITRDGDVQVEQINRDGTRKKHLFKEQLSRDDHNSPSLAILSDGNLMISFSEHNGRTIYNSKTTVPGEVDSFASIDKFRARIEGDGFRGFTYPSLIPIKPESGPEKLYLFWRGADWSPQMSHYDFVKKKWSNPDSLIHTIYEDQRPYAKYFSDGKGRIHMAFTDGHPSVNDENAIYYMVFDGQKFLRADGSIIGAVSDLPFKLSKLDKVYHPSLFDPKAPFNRAWIWSLAVDPSGKPAVAYSVTDSSFYHSYWYGFWNGKEWVRRIVTSGGTTIQKNEKFESQEPYYAGGVAIDPRDISRVFVSAERQTNFHEIEEWKLDPSRSKFSFVKKLSNERTKAFRPVVPQVFGLGEGQAPLFDVLWMEGEYNYYTDYDTSIQGRLTEPGVKVADEAIQPKVASAPVREDRTVIEGDSEAPQSSYPSDGRVYKSVRSDTPPQVAEWPAANFDRTKIVNIKDQNLRGLLPESLTPDSSRIDRRLSVFYTYITDTWDRITGYNAAELRNRAEEHKIPIASFKYNWVKPREDGSLVIKDVQFYIIDCVNKSCTEYAKEFVHTLDLEFDKNGNMIRKGF